MLIQKVSGYCSMLMDRACRCVIYRILQLPADVFQSPESVDIPQDHVRRCDQVMDGVDSHHKKRYYGPTAPGTWVDGETHGTATGIVRRPDLHECDVVLHQCLALCILENESRHCWRALEALVSARKARDSSCYMSHSFAWII